MENYQNPQQAPVQAQEFAPAAPAPAKKKPAFMKFLPIVAIVVVVAIIAVALIGGSGYKKALEKVLAYNFDFETSNIEDLLPEVVWEDYADEMDGDVSDLVDEFVDYAEENKEEIEEFGISITYEIGEYEKMDKDDLEDLKEEISDNYDCIDEDDIGNKAYTVEVEYEASFEDYDETEKEDVELYIVKINGDWYVVNELGYFAVDM